MTRQESLTRAMRRALLSGEFAVGQVVTESEFANRFGVSKTPVAEALTELAWTGWVCALPRRGYRIEEVTISQAWEALGLLEELLTSLLSRGAWPTSARPHHTGGVWDVLRSLVDEEVSPWQAVALTEVTDRLERIVRLSGAGAAPIVPGGVSDAMAALTTGSQPQPEQIRQACRELRRWIQDLLMQSATPLTR